MRAVRYYGPGDVRVDEIPEPVPQEGQVKIKVESHRMVPHLSGTHRSSDRMVGTVLHLDEVDPVHI